jgi:hypothetical protein
MSAMNTDPAKGTRRGTGVAADILEGPSVTAS